MIRPSRSEPIVLTSKLGVEYHMSYVGQVTNANPKPRDPHSSTPFGQQMDWYNVDAHNRYAQYLEKEPR